MHDAHERPKKHVWMAMICVLLVASACGDDDGRDVGSCDALAADLTTALDETLAAEKRLGGTAAAVITPACGRWQGAVGKTGGDKALTSNHLLRVGSVTKTFVAATALSLVAEGALGLDDTLDTWALELPNADTITLRQLLNHTSGIYNYTDDEAFIAAALSDPTAAHSPQDLVDTALAQPPLFNPGDGWAYSNTNYILLGMIIEAVTANPAVAEIRSRTIDPHSLEHTFIAGDEAVNGTLANGFGPDGEDVTHALHPSAAWTAGNMVGTAGDMVEWAMALYGGQVLDQEEFDEMLDVIEVDEVPGGSYGLGVISYDAGVVGTPAIGHSGGVPGFTTEMYYLTDFDSAVVTVVNSEAGDSVAVLKRLIAEITER
ncbi:MAG: beta-lactamase family protein [Proteobacteria bacterium]|nr:beta-lactamase family protein [Pseudomonadota bacterium]